MLKSLLSLISKVGSIDHFMYISLVFSIMAIVGDYGSQKTWGVIMPGGVQCTDHGLPDMPQVKQSPICPVLGHQMTL